MNLFTKLFRFVYTYEIVLVCCCRCRCRYRRRRRLGCGCSLVCPLALFISLKTFFSHSLFRILLAWDRCAHRFVCVSGVFVASHSISVFTSQIHECSARLTQTIAPMWATNYAHSIFACVCVCAIHRYTHTDSRPSRIVADFLFSFFFVRRSYACRVWLVYAIGSTNVAPFFLSLHNAMRLYISTTHLRCASDAIAISPFHIWWIFATKPTSASSSSRSSSKKRMKRYYKIPSDQRKIEMDGSQVSDGGVKWVQSTAECMHLIWFWMKSMAFLCSSLISFDLFLFYFPHQRISRQCKCGWYVSNGPIQHTQKP